MAYLTTVTIDATNAAGQPVTFQAQAVDRNPTVSIIINGVTYYVARRDLFMAIVSLCGDVDDDMTTGAPA